MISPDYTFSIFNLWTRLSTFDVFSLNHMLQLTIRECARSKKTLSSQVILSSHQRSHLFMKFWQFHFSKFSKLFHFIRNFWFVKRVCQVYKCLAHSIQKRTIFRLKCYKKCSRSSKPENHKECPFRSKAHEFQTLSWRHGLKPNQRNVDFWWRRKKNEKKKRRNPSKLSQQCIKQTNL